MILVRHLEQQPWCFLRKDFGLSAFKRSSRRPWEGLVRQLFHSWRHGWTLGLSLFILLIYFSLSISHQFQKPLLFHPRWQAQFEKSLPFSIWESVNSFVDSFLRTFWQYSTDPYLFWVIYAYFHNVTAQNERNCSTGLQHGYWRHYTQWECHTHKKARLSDSAWRSLQKVRSNQTEANVGLTGQRWMESWVFTRYRPQFAKAEIVLEMDGVMAAHQCVPSN